MMKRIIDIESTIRDSQFYKIEFQFEHYSNEIKANNSIKFSFIKSEKELIELTLVNPEKIDLFDDAFGVVYVSHIKAFANQDTFFICFDPYDERIDNIDEKDNYVFQSQGYKIAINQLKNVGVVKI